MTQSIFNSVRKLNFYNFKTKYINQNESVGEFFKKQSIEDFGSIPEPSCIDYDDKLSLLGIASKKGLIKIFGCPGVCYSTRLEGQDEIWNIKFIPGTSRMLIVASKCHKDWERKGTKCGSFLLLTKQNANIYKTDCKNSSQRLTSETSISSKINMSINIHLDSTK